MVLDEQLPTIDQRSVEFMCRMAEDMINIFGFAGAVGLLCAVIQNSSTFLQCGKMDWVTMTRISAIIDERPIETWIAMLKAEGLFHEDCATPASERVLASAGLDRTTAKT